MPINRNELQKVLSEMKADRIQKGLKSVHTHSFIDMLHNYCVEELERSGLNIKKPDIEILTKKSIPRLDKFKEVDVCVLHKQAGPLLTISIKSIMSSVTNNFTNNYEMMVGDAAFFHERYPLLVMGHIMLIPEDNSLFTSDKKPEKYNLSYYAHLLDKVNNRRDYNDNPNRFERIALLVVDFKKKQPQINNSIPSQSSLKIDNFFSDLITKYIERNSTLDIL